MPDEPQPDVDALAAEVDESAVPEPYLERRNPQPGLRDLGDLDSVPDDWQG